MIELREDLPLGPESPDDGVGIHAALDDFERDLALEVVVAPRQVDGAHAAAADESHDRVGTDARRIAAAAISAAPGLAVMPSIGACAAAGTSRNASV